MQTTITAKLKLGTTPEQFTALRQTQLAYRDALNQTSQHAFAHGKTSNSQRLQKTSGKAPVIDPGDEPPFLFGAGGGPMYRACRVLDTSPHVE